MSAGCAKIAAQTPLLKAIKQAPQYTELTLFTRDNEIQLHRHYDKKGYWTAERVEEEHGRRQAEGKDLKG